MISPFATSVSAAPVGLRPGPGLAFAPHLATQPRVQAQPSAPVTGASTTSVNDPTGDNYLCCSGTNPGQAQGDLTNVSATYGTTSITVGLIAAAASNDVTDPAWTSGASSLLWYLDTKNDSTPEYYVNVYNTGTGAASGVFDFNTDAELCAGSSSTSQPTTSSFQVTFPATCLSTPPGFKVEGGMRYGTTLSVDANGNCTSCSTDYAPDAAYTPWVIPPVTSPAPLATYTPMTTSRIFDGTVSTVAVPIDVLAKGGVPTGVPNTATAVAVNVEVFNPSASGYLRVTPFGADSQVAAQEFTTGRSISNLVVVKVINGKLQARVSTGSARILVDVAGYYSNDTNGSLFTPLATTRIYNQPGSTTAAAVQVAGQGGVPNTATAVVANVEVSNPTANGYVRVTPFGSNPQVATQQFVAGKTISNLAVVQLSSGKIQVKLSAGTGQVLVDVAGYYGPSSSGGSHFTALNTTRIVNTSVGTTPSPASVTGVGGVPANATAVVVNVEVSNPTVAGYVRVTPYGSDPQVAVQEFVAHQTISNLVIMKVVDGRIQSKLSAGSAQVLMDVAGYYA